MDKLRYQILDINIVALINQPTLQLPNPPAAFQTEEFESIFRPAITYSQGLAFDPSRGAAMTHQYESMVSQKVIAVSPLRLDVHDRSGKQQETPSDLPELFLKTVAALNINTIQALGINCELQFKVQDVAAKVIATKALADVQAFAPEGSRVQGGAARFYFNGSEGALYTIVIEPRNQDLTTNMIWMSCNYHIPKSAIPSIDELSVLHGHSFTAVMRFTEGLFG